MSPQETSPTLKSYLNCTPTLTLQDKTQSGHRSSEGSGTTPEVLDEPKDNSAVVAEKQAGYVQTNLTLSSTELEIQSMVDVPIHQKDLAVQRTPLIDLVSHWLLKRQHQHLYHQPHKLMFKCVQTLAGKTFQEEFRSAGWCKENSDGQKTVAEDKINTRNESASLKNLETQIEQLTKELQSRTTSGAPSSSTGNPNETIILGIPFLATIHAKIHVLNREISLGVGALDPDKDPRERSFYDYKWVFDLEIEQLADEYELGIGKNGHILDMIWENCKNIQGSSS
ncbi:hypothetical protein Tco_1419189 [Tanacetum coccineum]